MLYKTNEETIMIKDIRVMTSQEHTILLVARIKLTI